MSIDLKSVQEFIDQRWNDEGEKFRVISATNNAHNYICNGIHDYCYEGLILLHDDKRDRYIIGSCWDSGVGSDAYAIDDPALEDFFRALANILQKGDPA